MHVTGPLRRSFFSTSHKNAIIFEYFINLSLAGVKLVFFQRFQAQKIIKEECGQNIQIIIRVYSTSEYFYIKTEKET